VPSNFKDFSLLWYDFSDNYVTSSEIKSHVKGIPVFTDRGSGEVNQLEVVLRARDGRFITSSTPVTIEKFDRLQLKITDINGNKYSGDGRLFEVVDMIPSQSKSQGTLLTLQCLGIEYHTQHIHYIKPHWFEEANAVGKDIGELYNSNRGTTAQPLLTAHDDATYSTSTKKGNGLPAFTSNNYEFGLVEESCYNRWMDVTDKMGATVSAGGVKDFFDLGFDTPSVQQLDIAIFSSGARSFDGNDPANDGSAVTIEKTTSINVGEQEGELSNPTGSNVLSWGSPDHGSLPIEFSKYVSGELQFFFRPEWSASLTYLAGSKVKVTVTATGVATHYEADADDTTTTPPTGWTVIDMGSEFGDTLQYSLWTDDKAVLWANGGAKPLTHITAPAWLTSTAYLIGDVVVDASVQYRCLAGHTSSGGNKPPSSFWEVVDNARSGNGAFMFDANIVVFHDGFFRTWVDWRGTDSASFPTELLYANTTYYRGLRVLIDGTGANDFAGFTDKIIEYDGAAWFAKYLIGSAQVKMQVANFADGLNYEWNGTDTWTSVGNVALANDCFHPYVSICNTDSVDPKPTTNDNTLHPEIGNTWSDNVRSAVTITYRPGDIKDKATDASSPTGNFYKQSGVICFRYPWPITDYGGISEGVGELYGGTTSTGQEPATLDTQNMHLTHNGLRGFNQAADVSEDFGQISAYAFMLAVELKDKNENILDGVVNFSCYHGDTEDNIVRQDFSIPFVKDSENQQHWEDVVLPLSGFTAYRANKPWYIVDSGFSNLTAPKEIDVQNIFNWRNLKWTVIQIRDFYDQFGRFSPTGEIDDASAVDLSELLGGIIAVSIDAVHWVKPLLVTSGAQGASTHELEPDFLQRPHIATYDQLKNDAKSQVEIEKFQHKQFDMRTSGHSTFDIRFGDTFFLLNSSLVSDASRNESAIGSDDGDANTIRLVAKAIEFSLTKPTSGGGGLTRRIVGSRRFV